MSRFALVAVLVFLLRLPFLGAGYGWDSDAWRVASAAAAMAETGDYIAPRLPGNPVHDIATALLWSLGPWARAPAVLNGASALVSALGAGAFALAWRRCGLPDAVLAGVAVASVPAVFVASVSTLDYAWGFAFVAASLAAVIHGKTTLAGAFAALAVGTRLSNVVLVLGTALLLFDLWRPRPGLVLRLAGFVALWSVAGLVPYLPLWIERGAAAVTWYDHGYPSLSLILKKATVDLWGWLGFTAWVLLVLAAMVRARTGRAIRRAEPATAPASAGLRRVAAPAGATSGLALAAWLRLPYKATYLVPAVPFLLISQVFHLRARAMRILLASLLVAPWILSVYAPGKDDDPGPSRWAYPVTVGGRALVVDLRGPILLDHARRKAGLAYVARITRAARRLPPGSALVVQDWLPHLRLVLDRVRGPVERDGVLFTHLLDRPALDALKKERRQVYYLPGIELANQAKFGVDLVAAGARPLIP